MKVFCSFSTIVRMLCWIAGVCLVAGVALGHGGEQAPASGAERPAATANVLP